MQNVFVTLFHAITIEDRSFKAPKKLRTTIKVVQICVLNSSEILALGEKRTEDLVVIH